MIIMIIIMIIMIITMIVMKILIARDPPYVAITIVTDKRPWIAAKNMMVISYATPDYKWMKFCTFDQWLKLYLISECCKVIKVENTGSLKYTWQLPKLFTTYAIEYDLVNGHRHYTSLDGLHAIAFNKDHNKWKIQSVANR